jgi:V-type H+-transporting ATPase subunit a
MTFGLFLSLVNHIYFKRTKSIFCEFIPQILFLQSVFGYMCFLIVLKWTIDYEDPGTAPRILNLMTEMILSPWTLSDKYSIYPGQHLIQVMLLGVAGICVPWMFFAKPIFDWIQHRRAQRRRLIYQAAKGIPMVILDEDGNEIEEDHHNEDDFDEQLLVSL